MTALIQEYPADARLYLQRAELHRLDRNWDDALGDYGTARRLSPGLQVLSFHEGRTWLDAGKPLKAKPLLDQFLAIEPGHTGALLVRSRILAEIGYPVAAAEDLREALSQMRSPSPDVYLERARLLASAGGHHVDESLRTIEEGISELGPLVTLIQFAVVLESDRGRHLEALDYMNRLPSRVRRQPHWLKRRGDALHKAGRIMDARDTYRAALTQIERLPKSRRYVKVMVELESSLRELLESTGTMVH